MRTPKPGGHTAMFQYAGHHFGACLPGILKARLTAPDPLFKGNTGYYPENVGFVRVSQKLCKRQRPGVQPIGKHELVVLPDRDLRCFFPALRQPFFGEAVKKSVPEQNVPAQLRVIHRLGIHKGTEAPDLLEASDIMQQAKEPGKRGVLGAHAERLRVALREHCHTEGVLNFMGDQDVLCVILLRISQKYILCLFLVKHADFAPPVLSQAAARSPSPVCVMIPRTNSIDSLSTRFLSSPLNPCPAPSMITVRASASTRSALCVYASGT